ncbi:YeiH family protein [Pseudonocardia yuanmonensis]|uniref:YeiH family protein n=1 Tax=Pseudonocardia yuanmonensis TaxID=1095914 RepID=A0ABP8XAR5_9PSEU
MIVPAESAGGIRYTRPELGPRQHAVSAVLARRAGSILRRLGPGLLLAMAVAGVATLVGRAVPLVGGPVVAIVLGAAVGALVKPGARLDPGLAVASRPVLQLSIVVYGTGLSLAQVADVGLGSLPVMLSTLAVALGGGWLIGRLLGVRGDGQTLIAVGTGICGASAIAATSAVIQPKRADIAYSVGVIFTFNIVAVLLFPPLGHLLGLDQQAFGLWAGTAINDTSSVVAASVAYGNEAGQHGIVVKLTRTLTLIPIVIALGALKARRRIEGQGLRSIPWRKVVPLFLLGFLAAAAMQSLGLIPSGWHEPLSLIGTFLLTTALAGIGLNLRFSEMRAAGVRPLLFGGLLWVAVAATGLGMQAVFGLL